MRSDARTVRRAALLVTAALFPTHHTRSATMPVETTTPNEQAVRRIYDECLNQGRTDALRDLVSDDYVGPQGERGAAGFGQPIAALRAGFPDIRFAIEDVVASGDRVAVRWTWRATHTGTFRGLAPSGRAVTDTGMAIYQLRGGRILRAWVETDRLGVLQQIGVVPADVGTPHPRN